MPEEKKPTGIDIIKKQSLDAENRQHKLLDMFYQASQHGLKEGVLKAAQEKDPSIKSFADLTAQHYREHNEAGAKTASGHINDLVLQYFLDDNKLSGASELNKEVTDHMYRALFGKKALTPDGKGGQKEVDISADYIQNIFQALYTNADSKLLDVGSILKTSGLEKSIGQAVLYDFGKGITTKDHGKEIVDYLGIGEYVKADGLLEQDAQRLASLTLNKLRKPEDHDADKLGYAMIDIIPHAVSQKVVDFYNGKDQETQDKKAA